MGYTFALEENPAPADEEVVRGGLDAFNERYAPAANYTLLHVFLRDEQGEVVGGLLGATYWGWLYVDVLWLADEARGAGFGAAMLEQAEQEARHRGCRHAHLDALGWQALPFYLKQGYGEWGRLEDVADGHTRYFLKKDL